MSETPQWMIDLLKDYRARITSHYLEEIGCRAYPVNDPPPDKLPDMEDVPDYLVRRARIGGITDAIEQSYPLDIAMAFCGGFTDHPPFFGEDAETESALGAYRGQGITRINGRRV